MVAVVALCAGTGPSDAGDLKDKPEALSPGRGFLPPAFGAVASAPSSYGASSASKDAAVAAYRTSVFARIGEVNDFARRTKGVPSTATVVFAIDSHGGLTSAAISKASGHPAFDAEVVAMIRKAAPFAPPPPGAPATFSATIRFKPAGRS